VTTRPTLVLVPGLSGRPEIDFPFFAPMLRRWFDVTEVTFDGLADPTLAALAARVTAAVDACATPPIVVGYSLGALAAAASRAPVAGLVLVAGWWQPSPTLELFARVWATLRAEHSDAVEEVARFALASAEGLATVPALPADALTDALVALAARADLTSAPAFAAPVLVVGTSADALAPPHQSRLLFGAIPDARYAEVRSGHAVPHERPAELLELVTTFAADPHRYPSGTVIPERAP
jgi:hypothetical protein